MKKYLKTFFLLLLLTILTVGCSDEDSAQELQTEQEETHTEALETEETDAQTMAKDSTFEVHFIDVGQADATLIKCDGKNMLIDGGNKEDSSLIYTYLKEQDVEVLDYVIATHAHEDHIGGLAGALNYAQAEVVYSPVTAFETEAFQDFVKYVEKQEKNITIPDPGTKFMLGSATCTILGVNTYDDDPNNTSIVLRVEYGETAFLFSGDAQDSVESAILDAGYDISCTVLKVPHHGSEMSLSYRWIREAMPQYGIISVGADNAYGHPNEDTLSRLRDAEVEVYRTDMQGDIICTSDGENVFFETEKNSTVVPGKTDLETENEGIGTYILNTNTHKFHYPNCRSVDDMKEKNKQEETASRDEIIAQGYDPCGNCNP